jgi:type I restriction enzyme R subunit
VGWGWPYFERELFGKAMIVAMSRRIAVDLYTKIVALRPDWHSDDPAAGQIKVVMTGSAADPQKYQPQTSPALQGRPQAAQASGEGP